MAVVDGSGHLQLLWGPYGRPTAVPSTALAAFTRPGWYADQIMLKLGEGAEVAKGETRVAKESPTADLEQGVYTRHGRVSGMRRPGGCIDGPP